MLRKYFAPLLPFLVGWILIMLVPPFTEVALINGLLQLVLFAFVVCLPAWRTGRMSYVDIGWPWGLVVIGLCAFIFLDGHWLRKLLVSAVYLFIGLRMGVMAVKMWKLGAFKKELARYQYQRRRWEKAGKENIPLLLQVEAIVQGLANASFLALPAFIIAMNPSPTLSILEIIGLGLWLGAYIMETVADTQKHKFLMEMKRSGVKNQVCNVGLWNYSRHPNYFAEWMVWNALVIAAIPSWLALYGSMHVVVWALLGCGALMASRLMYTTLVYYTGAVPAEYYSVQKRPEYKQYQETTNMFFPGPVRN